MQRACTCAQRVRAATCRSAGVDLRCVPLLFQSSNPRPPSPPFLAVHPIQYMTNLLCYCQVGWCKPLGLPGSTPGVTREFHITTTTTRAVWCVPHRIHPHLLHSLPLLQSIDPGFEPESMMTRAPRQVIDSATTDGCGDHLMVTGCGTMMMVSEWPRWNSMCRGCHRSGKEGHSGKEGSGLQPWWEGCTLTHDPTCDCPERCDANGKH